MPKKTKMQKLREMTLNHGSANIQSPDGEVFTTNPSLRATQNQVVHKYNLIVQQWKRYSMSVGVSPITDSISFSLSQIPGIQNFLNIYDFYRIRQVVVLFKVVGTTNYIGNSSGDIPRVGVAIDYNDNTSTGAPAESYQNCVSTNMITPFVRRFSPRTAIGLYNGSLSTAYIQGRPDQWIDTNYPAVPHYGLVINIGSTSLDAQFVYAVDVLFQLEFKDVRFFASLTQVDPSDNMKRKSLRVIGGGSSSRQRSVDRGSEPPSGRQSAQTRYTVESSDELHQDSQYV